MPSTTGSNTKNAQPYAVRPKCKKMKPVTRNVKVRIIDSLKLRSRSIVFIIFCSEDIIGNAYRKLFSFPIYRLSQ